MSNTAEKAVASRSRSPKIRDGRAYGQDGAVGEVIAERGTAFCCKGKTLVDAADTLISSKRTAAIVGYTDDGQLCGVLTENDFLAALAKGTSPKCSIYDWLHGEHARFPGSMIEALTVSPKTSLAEAAAVMVSEADKDSGYACHHVLLSDKDHVPRLVSAMDIACAMMASLEAQEKQTLTVKEAMKHRADVTTCTLGDTPLQAYQAMYDSNQNCALAAVGKKHHGHHFMITAADALRTFSEYLHGDETTVVQWLHGLTETEHPTEKQRSIHADASLPDAAKMMADHGVHHLAVLGVGADAKMVVGILSSLDIVRRLSTRGLHGHAQASRGGS